MTSLLDEATTLPALLAATRRASLGKRSRPAVARFLMDAERECLRLQHALRLPVEHPDAWRPGAADQFWIRDPRPRFITVAPFADRVVHHALCAVAEPIFERRATFDSYACRTGKGQHAALRRARSFAAGTPFALKCDIAVCFASIPHDRLIALLVRVIRDEGLRGRLERIVRAWPGGRGIPIGALTSQHLANLYLGEIDPLLKDVLCVRCYLRYMDDFIAFGERAALVGLFGRIDDFVRDRLGLALNPRSTRIVAVRDGVPFLGFRVFPRLIRPAAARWRRFRRRHLWIERELAAGRASEEEAWARVASQFVHLAAFDTFRLRSRHRSRLRGAGAGRDRLQPREPRRLVHQYGYEPPGREPQQERAVRPRQEPRLSPFELSTTPPGVRPGLTSRPEAFDPRIGRLCPGADQARVQRRAHRAFEGGGRTEPYRPGGGLLRGVVAGPLSPIEVAR